jgi:hypothetical protein
MKYLIEALRGLRPSPVECERAADALERLTTVGIALPKTQWLGDIPGFIISQLKDYCDRMYAAAVLSERERIANNLEHGYLDDEGHHLQYAKAIRKGIP